MILVDASIWMDHLRSEDILLRNFLANDQVMMHSMVLGELAMGYLRNRDYMLGFFRNIPQIKSASDEEVLAAIEEYQLMGKGIGWVDAHLLVAVLQSEGIKLWTRDKRLNSLAQELNLTVDF
jgi:predicted nucleic acid-binding protein